MKKLCKKALHYEAKLASLKSKTLPKQLVGSLPLNVLLPNKRFLRLWTNRSCKQLLQNIRTIKGAFTRPILQCDFKVRCVFKAQECKSLRRNCTCKCNLRACTSKRFTAAIIIYRNKLARLSLSHKSNFQAKLEPTNTGLHSKGRPLALPENITQGWTWLMGTNTLSYCNTKLISAAKRV